MLINRNELKKAIMKMVELPDAIRVQFIATINRAKPVDAVPKEQYIDLREDFVDYVCSGVPFPSPYCKNRCDECVDRHGLCTYKRCRGFDPDGGVFYDGK